jgi:acetyl-CoA acetyltransferase
MRNVAILSFAQTPYLRSETERNEVEMLMPVLAEAIGASGLDRKQIDFTCSGSSDYLAG